MYNLSTRPFQGVMPDTDSFQRTCRTRNIRVRRAGIPRAYFNASRKGAYARSLTGFFANGRNESRLYALVLTGLIYTYLIQVSIVFVYISLGVRS